MRNTWIAILLSLGLLAGCGDSPEHKLLLANQLIKNQPDKALEMAEAVLKADIKNEKAAEMREQAMFIKAQALMALNQLDASRKVLEEIKAMKPDDPEPIRSLALWAMRSMNFAVNKSEFETSVELQKMFEDAMVFGEAQADVLRSRHNLVAESEFLRARVILQDVARYRRMQQDEQKKADRLRILGDDTVGREVQQTIERLQKMVNMRSAEVEKHLLATTSLDPGHPQAGLMYVEMLAHKDRQGYRELIEIADKVVVAEKATADFVQQLARTILGSVPDALM